MHKGKVKKIHYLRCVTTLLANHLAFGWCKFTPAAVTGVVCEVIGPEQC